MIVACPHCQKKNRLPVDRLAESPACGVCGKPMLAGVLSLDASALSELTQKPTNAQSQAIPVMVDFWAPWCGPCLQFAPTFANAANQHGGRMVFAKVDTEAHQSVAIAHQIRSIPTLIVFHHGQSIQRVSGALAPSALAQLVAQVLEKNRT
jgi:thioredoxin 2